MLHVCRPDPPDVNIAIMKRMKPLLPVFAGLLTCLFSAAQPAPPRGGNDVTAPLHAMRVDYPVPYEAPTAASIKTVLDRIYNYLDTTTPPQFINRTTRQPVTDFSIADSNTVFKQGSFRITSYEWGVTYAGMLNAGEATGDAKYTNYTRQRLQLLADAFPAMKAMYQKNKQGSNPLRGLIDPHALDDGGAITASIIKTIRAGGSAMLRPLADNFVNYISTKEFRLADGTLARNRPQPNTLWLDDLFMGVPALAQMGKLNRRCKIL